MAEPLNEAHLAVLSKHKLKHEKELACAYDNLTTYEVDTLIQYCFSPQEDKYTHLLLASLFTGRTVSDLLDDSVLLDTAVIDNLGMLSSSISHPESPKPKIATQTSASYNSSPYVFLPSILLKSIRCIRGCDVVDCEKKLKAVLSNINKKTNTRLTLGRIQRYLAKEAKTHSISQAEVGWISNTRLRDHAGSSYLSMSSGDLARKHYSFINALMESATLEPFNLKALLSSSSSAETLGSNRGLTNETLQIAFANIREAVSSSQAKLPGSLWQLYNDYTHYTVALLMVNTGHRPTRHPFGLLSNFDLNREVIWIQDKEAREKTSRLVPLNKLSELQIRFYLSFLRKFKDAIIYSHPIEAEKLKLSLSGEDSLFRLKSSRGLTLYSASTVRKHCSSPIPGSSNWHRHWIRQYLASQPHIDASAVDAFMAHENLLDESFSRFSSLDTLELRKISSAIEQELQKLNLKALEVSL